MLLIGNTSNIKNNVGGLLVIGNSIYYGLVKEARHDELISPRQLNRFERQIKTNSGEIYNQRFSNYEPVATLKQVFGNVF